MSEPTGPESHGGATQTRSQPRWRRILVATLAVLACIMVPLSVHAVWINNTLLNTDQYVATVGPLATNPAIQNALANRVTSELVNPANVSQQIKTNLPPKVAGFIAPFVADGLTQLAHRLALRVLQSPKFAAVWDGLNRRVHTQLVSLLKGQGRFAKNGEVVIDLAPVTQKVAQALDKVGIKGLAGKVQQANHQFVLFKSPALKDTQGGVRVLDALAIVLPILTVLLLAGAFLLSAKRRKTILHTALGVALAVALPLVAYNLLRQVYVNALPASVNGAAAKAVYDQLLTFLRLALRTIFVLALVTALGAWLAGPGRVASRVRTGARDLVRRAPGQSWASPRVVNFVERNRNPLRVGTVGIGLAILVFLSAPGPLAVLVIAILVLVLLALIELLRRGAGVPSQTAN